MFSALWVDLFFTFVIIFGVAFGIKKGFFIELLKCLFLFIATIIALHYFSLMGNFLDDHFDLPGFDNHLAMYLSLIIVVFFLGWLSKEGWLIILDYKLPPRVQKVLGGCVGFFNGFMLVGLIVFGLMIPANESYNRSLFAANFSHVWTRVSTKIYKVTFDRAIGPFFAEEINLEAFGVIDPENARKKTLHQKNKR